MVWQELSAIGVTDRSLKHLVDRAHSGGVHGLSLDVVADVDTPVSIVVAQSAVRDRCSAQMCRRGTGRMQTFGRCPPWVLDIAVMFSGDSLSGPGWADGKPAQSAPEETCRVGDVIWPRCT